MAFIELTNEKTPKLAVGVDNALNYRDSEGNVQIRKIKTTLEDVLVEAGKVSTMDKGKVTFSAQVNGEWKNYFVNKDKDDNIVLADTKNPHDRDSKIYVNKVMKEDGHHFYSISNNTQAGKDLIEGINLDTVKREQGDSQYLKVAVRLKNDDLKADLEQKGKGHTAILSKDGYRIEKTEDLKKAVAKSKDKEVANEKKAEKQKSQGVER